MVLSPMPRGGTLITRIRLTSSAGFATRRRKADHILDLAPAVEALRPHQAVGHAGAHEGFLQQAGLGVGAVHHGKIIGCRLCRDAEVLLDGIHHVRRLRRMSSAASYRTILLPLPRSVNRCLGVRLWLRSITGGRHPARSGWSGSSAPAGSSALREILLEAQHVAVIRPAPAVDGLVFIADHEDVVDDTKKAAAAARTGARLVSWNSSTSTC